MIRATDEIFSRFSVARKSRHSKCHRFASDAESARRKGGKLHRCDPDGRDPQERVYGEAWRGEGLVGAWKYDLPGVPSRAPARDLIFKARCEEGFLVLARDDRPRNGE